MTISKDTNPVAAAVYAISGGRFRVRLEDPTARPGQRSGAVLDGAGEWIGDASDYIYGGRGFAVHTKPFAGYVPAECVDFVEEAKS